MEIEKSALKIVPFEHKMTILEVPQDDLDRVGGLSEVLGNIIAKCKNENPAPVTIYTYFLPLSFNFSTHCDTMLLGICGNPSIAKCVELVLRDIYKLNVRIESTLPRDGVSCAYHFEDGRLWESIDPELFYSSDDMPDSNPEKDESVSGTTEFDEPQDEDQEECAEEAEAATGNNLVARRTYRARADSSIASLISNISRTYGIPEDSIKIVNPNGNPLRLNSTVERLRSIWEK